MIAKEKANELVDRYLNIEGSDDCGNSYSYIAKQSALICVDEIIEALRINEWQNRLVIEFYEEVKQELNKL